MANSIPSHQDQTKVRVFCVEPESCVGRDEDGNALIVTETVAVNIGNTWWLTKPSFEVIRKLTVKKAHSLYSQFEANGNGSFSPLP